MTQGERYPAGFAAATSVAAATIGPLVPPSIPMIFYALIANTSVGAMFLAGLVPAALMAGALMVAIALIARQPRHSRANLPRRLRAIPRLVLARACRPLVLPGLLLGIIYSGIATPTEAAAIAAAYALLLAFVVYRTLTRARLAGRDGRYGAHHGHDRADHVRRLRVQLRRRQRGRARRVAGRPARDAPLRHRLPVMHQSADAAAGRGDRRGYHPARRRPAAGAGGASAWASTRCSSASSWWST